MKYDVFISYGRKDTEIVNEFVNRLESEGVKVWIDRDGIESGDAFKRVIVNAIKESALFLFFSSKYSNASPWTTKEVGIAVHYQKPIIPIRIDNALYCEDIEFDLVNLDYIDYSEPDMRHPMMEKLVRTVKSKLPRREEKDMAAMETTTQPETKEPAPVAHRDEVHVEKEPLREETPKDTGKKSKKTLGIVMGLVAVAAVAVLLLFVLGPHDGRPEEEPVAYEDLTFTVNGVSFIMKPVEGEAYMMGGTDDNQSHEVEVSSFYMGETEVTQALWKAVMDNVPTHNGGWTEEKGLGDNYPAYEISWNEIQIFIRKLNALTNKDFRLPTEVEWEFAARGGKKANGYLYAGSPRVEEVAWYNRNSDNTTHEVRQLKPNELGLYDMSGNVWEWCSNLFDAEASDATMRVIRGGGWNRNVDCCQVSFRGKGGPDFKGDSHGFRLALSM